MTISPPDPPLGDANIVLRQWTEADAPAIAAACSEEEIARWNQVPVPYTERDARAYVASTRRGWREGTIASFASLDRETHAPGGSISVSWLEARGGGGGCRGTRGARGHGVAARGGRRAARGAEEGRRRRRR